MRNYIHYFHVHKNYKSEVVKLDLATYSSFFLRVMNMWKRIQIYAVGGVYRHTVS